MASASESGGRANQAVAWIPDALLWTEYSEVWANSELPQSHKDFCAVEGRLWIGGMIHDGCLSTATIDNGNDPTHVRWSVTVWPNRYKNGEESVYEGRAADPDTAKTECQTAADDHFLGPGAGWYAFAQRAMSDSTR